MQAMQVTYSSSLKEDKRPLRRSNRKQTGPLGIRRCSELNHHVGFGVRLHGALTLTQMTFPFPLRFSYAMCTGYLSGPIIKQTDPLGIRRSKLNCHISFKGRPHGDQIIRLTPDDFSISNGVFPMQYD